MEPIFGVILRASYTVNVFDDKQRLNLYALEHWNGKLRLFLDLIEKLYHFSNGEANSTKQNDLNVLSDRNQLQERIHKNAEILKEISILRAIQKKERGTRHNAADKLAVQKSTGKTLKTHSLSQRPNTGKVSNNN